MPRGGNRDGRETFVVDTLRLRNKGEIPPAPIRGAVEFYWREGSPYWLDDKGIEHQFGEVGVSPSIVDGINLDGFAEVFKVKNAFEQLEFRTLQSSDGTVNITQNPSNLDFTVDISDINDELDHGLLLGLSDDDHLQYALLAGRAGGQVLRGGTAASENLTLRSTAHATKGSVKIDDLSNFQFNSRIEAEYTVQTTNATPTTIASIPLADNTVYLVCVYLVSRRSDGGGQARSTTILRASAYRAAASAATLQGSVQQDFNQESIAGLDSDIIVSGNNLLVTVQGIAAQTYDWTAQVIWVARS